MERHHVCEVARHPEVQREGGLPEPLGASRIAPGLEKSSRDTLPEAANTRWTRRRLEAGTPVRRLPQKSKHAGRDGYENPVCKAAIIVTFCILLNLHLSSIEFTYVLSSHPKCTRRAGIFVCVVRCDIPSTYHAWHRVDASEIFGELINSFYQEVSQERGYL
nr:uncharacterized protein LOC109729454 [Microcebus murinus]